MFTFLRGARVSCPRRRDEGGTSLPPVACVTRFELCHGVFIAIAILLATYKGARQDWSFDDPVFDLALMLLNKGSGCALSSAWSSRRGYVSLDRNPCKTNYFISKTLDFIKI